MWLKRITDPDEAGGIPVIPPELVPVLEAVRARLDKAETALQSTTEELAFYRASANAMPNPIFLKDENLRFVFFNSAYRSFFNLTDDSYLGKRVLDLAYLPKEDRERYHAEDSGLLASQTALSYETVFTHSEDTVTESLYWSKGFTVPESGKRGLVGEIVDISAQKKTQRDLARTNEALELLMEDARNASKIDPGTKVFNRKALAEDVPDILRHAQNSGLSACIMLLDLDHFKQINDSFGHLYGDKALEQLADILKRSCRRDDYVIRYGGDEFLLVLTDIPLTTARKKAEQLCQRTRNEMILPDGRNASLSIGLTGLLPNDNVMTVIARADEALYIAKENGRDRVAVKA